MKKHFILAAMAVAAIFAGCSNENEENLMPNEGAPVNFVIDGPVTRTTTDADGLTSFVEGDKIAIYSNGLLNDMEGAEFTVGSGGALTGDASYTFNGLSGANFYAYYPIAAAGNASTATFTIATDQSVANALDTSDFMTATNNVNAATPDPISLSFKHRLTLVKVALSGITASAVEINNVKPTATWTYSGNAVTTSGEATTIKMGKNGNEYWAVIPAQTVNTGTVLFTITADGGKVYTYTPTVDNITFNEGTRKKFTLAISADGKTMVSLSKLADVQWGAEESVEGDVTEYVKNYISLTNESIATITDRYILDGGDTPWGFLAAKESSIPIGSAVNNNGTLTITTLETQLGFSWYNRTLYCYSPETLSPGEYTLSFQANTASANQFLYISLLSSIEVGSKTYNFCQIIPSGTSDTYTGCPRTITTTKTKYEFTVNTRQVVVNNSTGTGKVLSFATNSDDIVGFFLAIAFKPETFTISDIKLIKK